MHNDDAIREQGRQFMRDFIATELPNDVEYFDVIWDMLDESNMLGNFHPTSELQSRRDIGFLQFPVENILLPILIGVLSNFLFAIFWERRTRKEANDEYRNEAKDILRNPGKLSQEQIDHWIDLFLDTMEQLEQASQNSERHRDSDESNHR